MSARKKKAAPVTFDTVREIARALPGIEEGTCYGTPAFRVRGKFERSMLHGAGYLLA